MNQDNRVLGRQRARGLTPREIEHLTGALHTEAVATIDFNTVRDFRRLSRLLELPRVGHPARAARPLIA